MRNSAGLQVLLLFAATMLVAVATGSLFHYGFFWEAIYGTVETFAGIALVSRKGFQWAFEPEAAAVSRRLFLLRASI